MQTGNHINIKLIAATLAAVMTISASAPALALQDISPATSISSVSSVSSTGITTVSSSTGVTPTGVAVSSTGIGATSTGVAATTTGTAVAAAPVTVSIEEAVTMGLSNSIALRQVKNAIVINELSDEKTRHNIEKMEDAEDKLETAQARIDAATVALENNIMPVDYTIPGLGTVHKGEDLSKYPPQVKAAIAEYLKSQQTKIDVGNLSLSDAVNKADETIADKLNLASLSSMGLGDASTVLTTMTSSTLDVSKASFDIYKNQMAMLIKKSYYDALKAQKVLEVKKKAMERGQKQYEFAQAGYKEGMKAKDDMLMASVYYKGTQIAYKNAEGELNVALIKLRENMGIPMDQPLILTDVLAEAIEPQDLDEGLIRGMSKRLEIKKALAQEIIYITNFEQVKKYYPENTFQYREALNSKNEMIINFEKVRREVESSIRQSYATLQSTGEMLNLCKEMKAEAAENVEIAEFKYREGFGTESSLLKKLDIEASAGTMVEVLAAEENLSEVEEKVVEITYGYNMAKLKYFNDTGKYVY